MDKKKIWIGLAAIVAVVLIAYLLTRGPRGNGPEAGQVRVAAVLSLTGPASRFDAVKQRTLELALKRIKQANPNAQIELRVLDAGEGPEGTNVAVRQAVDWGASYILSGTSPAALAIASQVRNRNPPIVQMANAANPDFGPPKPGEYRLWPDWRQEAEVVTGVFRKEGINSVLLIHSSDPYSQALTNSLRELTGSINGFSMRDLQYDPATTPDFRPALLRSKQDGTQAIVIFGLPPGINALLSQMAEVKWDRSLIGGVNINLSVSNYDQAHLTGPLWLVETEAMQETLRAGSEAQAFRDAYKQQYNEVPPFHSLYLADALYFISTAQDITRGQNLTTVERAQRVRQFESASGRVDVGEDGILRFAMSARKAK